MQFQIPVFTAPYQRYYSAAETIISSIVLLSRHVLERSKECHKGEWNKVNPPDCIRSVNTIQTNSASSDVRVSFSHPPTIDVRHTNPTPSSSHCHEVRGKTLGIVGYGHVGSQVGVLAEALSLKVIFYDSIALMPIGRAQPVDSLDALLAQSDFVALNVPSSPENVKMIRKEHLEKMKKGSYLINASFGEAVSFFGMNCFYIKITKPSY